MVAHPEDPVGDELDALLRQPKINAWKSPSIRFEVGETRAIPHQWVRRGLGLEEFATEEPPADAEG